jgi:hypothetical protein
MKYEEVLHRVKEERDILHTIKRRKNNWFGHIFRRICLIKHVIKENTEGKIEGTRRRGRRRKQLMNDFNNMLRYLNLKAERLDLSFL